MSVDDGVPCGCRVASVPESLPLMGVTTRVEHDDARTPAAADRRVLLIFSDADWSTGSKRGVQALRRTGDSDQGDCAQTAGPELPVCARSFRRASRALRALHFCLAERRRSLHCSARRTVVRLCSVLGSECGGGRGEGRGGMTHRKGKLGGALRDT